MGLELRILQVCDGCGYDYDLGFDNPIELTIELIRNLSLEDQLPDGWKRDFPVGDTLYGVICDTCILDEEDTIKEETANAAN